MYRDDTKWTGQLLKRYDKNIFLSRFQSSTNFPGFYSIREPQYANIYYRGEKTIILTLKIP